jgi:hypothetical protein
VAAVYREMDETVTGFLRASGMRGRQWRGLLRADEKLPALAQPSRCS